MSLFGVETPSTACSLRFLLVSLCGENSCHDKYLINFRTAGIQSATKTFSIQDILGIQPISENSELSELVEREDLAMPSNRKTIQRMKLKTWNLTW